MLTDPNWLARVRILSTMLYPEAFVEGAQFSVGDSARLCVAGRGWLTVVPEDAYGVIRECGIRGSWIRLLGRGGWWGRRRHLLWASSR